MISRNTNKWAVFVESIAKRIDPGFPRYKVVGEVRPIVYFGSGYWRGVPVFSDDDEVDIEKAIGIRLVNPSRTAEEIAAVEAGLAVLVRGTYSKGSVDRVVEGFLG